MYKQLQQRGMESPPVNVATLRDMKLAREPIACLTAYDASFAQLVDMAGTDVVLVGDSLGMVMLGYDSTLPVTMDDMVRHTAAVRRDNTGFDFDAPAEVPETAPPAAAMREALTGPVREKLAEIYPEFAAVRLSAP